MLYLYSITIFIIMFIISINRKRIPPKSSGHAYITSPIDGKITNINFVEIKNEINGEIISLEFNEIIIQSHLLSSPYLYMPIQGNLKIIEKTLENFVVEISNKNYNLTISHGWRDIIHQFNYPILKDIQTYSGDNLRAGETYGRSIFVHYIKILIPIKNIITATVGQHVIGGETIISHN